MRHPRRLRLARLSTIPAPHHRHIHSTLPRHRPTTIIRRHLHRLTLHRHLPDRRVRHHRPFMIPTVLLHRFHVPLLLTKVDSSDYGTRCGAVMLNSRTIA